MSWRGRGLLWGAVLALAIGLGLGVRPALDKAHVVLLLLVVVLGASAHGGRTLGFTIATGAWVGLNWFFIPPYGSLRVADPRDWLVLAAFLGAAILAGQLLHQAKVAAAAAQAMADEAARLATEREALLQRSREAELLATEARAKDEVLASVSHDLRTPLTAIRVLAQELAAGGDERALAIEEEAIALSGLVSDVLDLSRLKTGTLPLDLQPNEAEDLIGAAIQRVQAAHAGRPITVTLEPGAPLRFARCDQAQTVRALANLLDNALRHTTGEVEVFVGRQGPWLELTVADRGAGVPSARRARLFEPYGLRGDGDRGGAGLGLSIVRALVEAQGGTVHHADRDGGGSRFVVRLPAVDVPEGPTP